VQECFRARSATLVGILEVGILEVGVLGVGILEVGIVEVGIVEVGILEVGIVEVGILMESRKTFDSFSPQCLRYIWTLRFFLALRMYLSRHPSVKS
jgi:hypothetical protein